jgi:hypothetical protein
MGILRRLRRDDDPMLHVECLERRLLCQQVCWPEIVYQVESSDFG